MSNPYRVALCGAVLFIVLLKIFEEARDKKKIYYNLFT